MDIIVKTAAGILQAGDLEMRCASGKNGAIAGADGREGDGKTPLGCYALRFGLYRKDRIALPDTGLCFHEILPDDGWCDAPDDPAYNRFVRLPYPASAEKLWRNDHVYDVVIGLGHNDSPPVAPMGSAIFLHIARQGYKPTQGCIAVSRDDMLRLLPGLTSQSHIHIT